MRRLLSFIALAALTAGAMRAQTPADTSLPACRSKDIPAPTAADLDPLNRHTACFYNSIALAGTPSREGCSLVWHPVDKDATPQWYGGDSVTISYRSKVGDVHVYNYDRKRQCLSAGYYVHKVEQLEPAELGLPHELTVGPGTLIAWGDDEVPDQSGEGMLYRWSIDDLRQRCASVQGTGLTNNVVLAVNEVETPTTFYVMLQRSFCGNFFARDYVVITVDSTAQGPWPKTDGRRAAPGGVFGAADSRCPELPEGTAAVSIVSANTDNTNMTCNNTPIKLTAQLAYPGSVVSAVWDFGDGSTLHASGDHVYHTFRAMATYNVTVTVTDDKGCVQKTIEPFYISSMHDPYEHMSLMRLMYMDLPAGEPQHLHASPSFHGVHHTWWRLKDPEHKTTGVDYYPARCSDDYFVYVVDQHYCQRQATAFVGFLNAPSSLPGQKTDK